MWHCYINYKIKDARVSEVFKTEQFHISAKTQQDIINMEAVISELLDRLEIEHTSRFVFHPSILLEGEENEHI